jgi:hypothetical protein
MRNTVRIDFNFKSIITFIRELYNREEESPKCWYKSRNIVLNTIFPHSKNFFVFKTEIFHIFQVRKKLKLQKRSAHPMKRA